jgi:hypothetical protein
MNLRYFEETKASAKGHRRPSCFVLDDKKLHFHKDTEVIRDLAKKMLDQLDHVQIYRLTQKLIKSNHIKAKRETNIETSPLLECKTSCIANSWEINI